jgi:alginate O-acetyltransferase complex protein AlgI
MYVVPYYLLLVLFTILTDYTISILMSKNAEKKKFFLAISLLINLGILISFKYLNFTINNINYISQIIGWNYSLNTLNIILPIGLSFYIFKSMSYLMDVFRGRISREPNLIKYATYVLYFPEILSGPIDRSRNLLPQLNEQHKFNVDNIKYGLRLFVWGLFKKVVIADRIAISINHVFGDLYSYSGTPLIITIIFYSFQIYCDFSGYSDMAIGTGRMMGIRLQNNFNMPYLSHSIPEFWRRWHITLSTWFRDYLFLPLSYSAFRKIQGKKIFGLKEDVAAYSYATIITMLLAGLWHGANWTFICWGFYLGTLLILSHSTKKLRSKFKKAIHLKYNSNLLKLFQICLTFGLITLSWILFRSENLNDAYYIITHIVKNITFQAKGNELGISMFHTLLSFILISGLIYIETLLDDDKTPVDLISRFTFPVRWFFYYLIILLIFCFGEFGAKSFVYFQF